MQLACHWSKTGCIMSIMGRCYSLYSCILLGGSIIRVLYTVKFPPAKTGDGILNLYGRCCRAREIRSIAGRQRGCCQCLNKGDHSCRGLALHENHNLQGHGSVYLPCIIYCSCTWKGMKITSRAPLRRFQQAGSSKAGTVMITVDLADCVECCYGLLIVSRGALDKCIQEVLAG